MQKYVYTLYDMYLDTFRLTTFISLVKQYHFGDAFLRTYLHLCIRTVFRTQNYIT